MLQYIIIVTLTNVPLDKKKIMLQSSNTFLDIKEHMSCVPIDHIVVTLDIVTLIGYVTRRSSNTLIDSM